MHVRPHLDYCDFIFHIPALPNRNSNDINLNHQMNTLESIQYQAALGVTGAWKGTNRDKIYEELGWESLHNRRYFRRITQFYKIMNGLSPQYLRDMFQIHVLIFTVQIQQTICILYSVEMKDFKTFFTLMLLNTGTILALSFVTHHLYQSLSLKFSL